MPAVTAAPVLPARRRRPNRARAIAAVCGVLAIFAALMVHTPPAARAEAVAPAAVTEGTLTWGIKASWRAYVGTSGTIPQGGATVTPDGLFAFPLTAGTYDAATRTTELSFAGGVRFQAYCTGSECLLDTTYANLRVVVSPVEQTLYGDWTGKPREGGATQTTLGVPLASLDVSDATVGTADGVTSWGDIVATATDRFETYDAGTLLDTVAFSYRGDGAKPDLAESWNAPGTPAYRMTDAAWWSASTSATERRLLVSDGGTAHVVQQSGTGAARAADIRTLDATTLAPIGAPLSLPVYNSLREPPVAYDPAADAVYWIGLPAAGRETDGYTLHRSTWHSDTGSFTTAQIGSFPYRIGSTRQWVYALTWNPAAGQVAIIAGQRDSFLRLFTAQPDGTYTATAHALPLPAAYDPAFASATSYSLLYGSSSATEADSMLLPLSDGSYLYTGGTGAAVGGAIVPVPVARYSIGPGGLAVSSVPDSVPADRYGYHGLARVGDRVIAYQRASGVRFLDVSTPSAVTAGPALRFAIPESSEFGIAGAPVIDRATGLYVGVNGSTSRLVAFDSDGVVHASSAVAGLRYAANRSLVVTATPTGAGFYVQARGAGGTDGYVRMERVGDVPRVTAQPTDAAALAGSERAAVFEVGVGGSPSPSVQWQSRPAGQSRFGDISGATEAQLSVSPDAAATGTQYRAVVSNAAGRVASAAATLIVRSAPTVTVPPASTTVYEGQRAVLQVLGAGNPEPVVSWQRRTQAGWQTVSSGEGIVVDGAHLTVSDAARAFDGAVFRAVLTNDVAATVSAEATLSVRARPTAPETELTYTGVALEWTGNAEMQGVPPFGGSNYFSAGISDGSAATYEAATDGVRILQRSAAGDVPATWDTRASHTAGGSQVVRLTSGTAVVRPDGSARVQWPGSFSVNFYGGLVPFTLTDPTLTVGADGRGTLTADASGYAGDMANPSVKTPIAPVSDVVVSTFSGVTVDTRNGFTVTPDYGGVEASIPTGQTPQNRTAAGWGSWPQAFVDVHLRTGLSSYWYSSGGSFDAKKPPAPFAVGFGDALPSLPAGPGTPTPTAQPEPTTPAQPVESATVQGSLMWGVKSSFRSYISGPIAKGTISVSGGAVAQGGAYWFGQSSTDWSAASGIGSAAYAGSVRFTGHSGILDLTLSDPVVRIDSATAGTMLVRAGGALTEFGRIDLAAASRTDVAGGVAYSNAPVTLTSSGARVFSYGSSQFYETGTPMDPVSFVVGSAATSAPSGATGTIVTASSSTWTPPATPPATTGLTVDPAVLQNLRPGSSITVTGAGFLPRESDIKVVLYSTPVVLDTGVTANADGVASWTGLLPADIAPGEHTLTFQGSTALGIHFTVAPAAPESIGCTVSAGELRWGFKESFRSYISGSIAHGDWTVADGATYRTPVFTWSGGAGAFDAGDTTGRVSFPGSVHFTGHDGLLSTTIANPTLVFTGPTTAYVLLDVSGLTMDDALAGRADAAQSVTQVPFVELDLASASLTISPDGTEVAATGVPAAITAQGYQAFPNYPEGTAFDPVSFTFRVADCAPASAAVPVAATDDQASASASSPDGDVARSWTVWLLGGIPAALLIALTVVFVMRSRRPTAPVADASTSAESAE